MRSPRWERLSTSRNVAAVVAAATCLTWTASVTAAGTTITVADSGTAATRVQAELTAALLAAQGYTVTRTTFPSAAAADAALQGGQADVYFTQTATLLERVAHRPKERDAAKLAGVLSAVLTPRGEAAMGTAPYDDAPQVACRKTAVRAYKLRGLVTLRQAAPKLIYAATAAHTVRADGLAAIGAKFKRVIVRSGNGRFDVIRSRTAHCVLSSGVEPRAARLGLVAISDAKRRLAGTPQRGVAVVSQAYLGGAPATFAPAVEQAAALLTAANARTLFGSVDIDGQDPATVAQGFLRGAGLIP